MHISNASRPYREHQVQPSLGQVTQANVKGWLTPLLRRLTHDDEPRIHYHQNGFGQGYWQVYDPVNQSRYRFSSEQEVRIWLEQRYSQP